MKPNRIFLLAMICLLSTLLFCWFSACGSDEETEEETPTPEPEPELPDCEFEYSDSPAGDGAVERGDLEWTVFDNGDDIDHHCAVNYVADLEFDDKDDWRLPTLEELAELYDNSNPQSVVCNVMPANITEPFVITCYLMWTDQEGTLPGLEAYQAYSFAGSAKQPEGSSQAVEYDTRPNMRALAVRDL